MQTGPFRTGGLIGRGPLTDNAVAGRRNLTQLVRSAQEVGRHAAI